MRLWVARVPDGQVVLSRVRDVTLDVDTLVGWLEWDEAIAALKPTEQPLALDLFPYDSTIEPNDLWLWLSRDEFTGGYADRVWINREKPVEIKPKYDRDECVEGGYFDIEAGGLMQCGSLNPEEITDFVVPRGACVHVIARPVEP